MTATVSVVIPVLDGARWLGDTLAVLAPLGLEVLVIDSGSRDDSVALARDAGVAVLEIARAGFGHGRTRNLGAERTSGELIAFLTQDATPVPGWLEALREAFALDPRVGAAFGPHLPRPDTSPMIARELTEFFRGFAPDGRPVLHGPGDDPFLSNVNAAYRRDCWRQIRFADVPYAEDQAFGRALPAAGWLKAYHPGMAVLHAHDYGAVGFARRYFDEYRGLRATTGHVERIGVRSTVRDVRGLVAADRRWLRERGAPRRELVRWTARSAVHHGSRKLFSALGSRAEALPDRIQATLSLERRGAAPPAAGPPLGRAVPAGPPTPYEHVLAVASEGVAPLLDAVPGMGERTPLHVAVVIPPFRRGSGGHNSILQMLHRLERMGHTVSLWLHDPAGLMRDQWPAAIRGDLREWFAPVQAPLLRGFEQWYGADVAVATSWDTVYPVLRLDACRARAYLVHDHENEFFATSAQSLWAERTYTYGLPCIAGSPWLKTLLEERYGADAVVFDFGVDHAVYHPRPVARRRDTVVFYSRDATPRRAVPLGLLALQELRRRRPDLRIVVYGDPAPPTAPFPVEHLGIVSPLELSWAFSEATVALCLSMTNYSLMPAEMLACGLPCVDLAGFSAETVFGADGPVELTAPDPIALADALERLLDDEELWRRRSQAGMEFVAERTWDRAAQQLEYGLRWALRLREARVESHRAAWSGAAGGPPAWAEFARAVAPAGATGRAATERLLARLAPADLAAVRAVLTPAQAERVAERGDEMLLLPYGVHHRVPEVLAKTGLRPDAPPDAVHAMARGEEEAGGSLYYGDLLSGVLAATGFDLAAAGAGLDFGCSSGRVVRVLAAAWPEVEWHGCDPIASSIEWARAHLPDVRWEVSGAKPPLPYPDAHFGVVVAVSIWSHFAEHAALTWLDEMHRVIRPGGRLVLTTHGYTTVTYDAAHGLRAHRQLEQIRDALFRRGFWFADEFGEGGDHGHRDAAWGTAFLTPEWLLGHLGGRWSVVHFGPGQNAANQDLYVLSRQP